VKSSAIQMPVIEEVAANQEVPQQHLRHSDTPLSCLAVELPCVVLVLLELAREVRQIALPWETRAVVQEFVLEFAQIFEEEGEDAPALPVNDALVLK